MAMAEHGEVMPKVPEKPPVTDGGFNGEGLRSTTGAMPVPGQTAGTCTARVDDRERLDAFPRILLQSPVIR